MFALWPVMWIVVNALLLYNIAVVSGRFDAFRDWMLDHLPNDRRVVLVVIGFCFGCLLEGISGFGTPVAITSALLILVGFPPLEALTFTLIFNTAPVAFGALGAPVTVLGQVTGLSPVTLGAMIGRQLPFMAMLLPFYVMALYGGLRSVRALWPVLLVAGVQLRRGPVRVVQLPRLRADRRALVADRADRHAGLPAGLAPGARPGVRDAARPRRCRRGPRRTRARLAGLAALGRGVGGRDRLDALQGLRDRPAGDPVAGPAQPGRDHALHDKPYAAIYVFQPLATGTAILLSAIITAALVGVGPARFLHASRHLAAEPHRHPDGRADRRPRLPDELFRPELHAGPGRRLGRLLFPLLSPFLGWVAVFLSGSDTSGNALFGNLQVVAANQLGLNPVLIAATNSSGGVMGKMISPQNIATGVSVTDLKGQEGVVFARTFKHSIVLTLLLGVLVVLQQYVVPWMIP